MTAKRAKTTRQPAADIPTNDYHALLRSPDWQRKRLEILNAHGFKCDECGAKDRELHVHHCYYRKGSKPWEYEDTCYKVLCSEDHAQRHAMKGVVDTLLAKRSQREIGWLISLLTSATAHDLNAVEYLLKMADIHKAGRNILTSVADLVCGVQKSRQGASR